MRKDKAIALVMVMLFVLASAWLVEPLMGPAPWAPWYKAFAVVYFLLAAGWMLREGHRGWKASKEAAEESEMEFLSAMERELEPAGGWVDVVDDLAGPESESGRGLGGAPGLSPLPAVPVGSAFPFSPAGASAGSGSGVSVSEIGGAGGWSGGNAGTGAPSSFSPGVEQLARDLQRLGVLTTFEGKLDLPAPSSPAPIYRLRSGGLALLLDELETHRFLAHQTRRFQAILVRGADGEALVVRRYQDFVTDQLDSPTEKG